MSDITIIDLHNLLKHFSKNTYGANNADSTSQAIMQRCILLADMDYSHTIINNNNGDLSAHYPSHLIILEYEKHKNLNLSETPPPPQRTTETIYESIYDTNRLKEIIKTARIARCRSRFPLPVILYKGRNVCRSSTLSGGPEIYGRSGLEYFFSSNDTNEQNTEESKRVNESTNNDWPHDKVRNQDIKLLRMLNVQTIIDFMVENKKVKYGMNVTSSEKVDKEHRYNDFTIVSLPYPGCEFFREFRENDYFAQGLLFDWSPSHLDATIRVPNDTIASQLNITWEKYKAWDLVNLTQNYLRLILKYLTDSSSGLLIHCISGWDRTPLFISLLRISLWADGAIHTSLTAYQLLYFTIAYDWMLFGHDLNDRLSKGEEIFYFCFYFLKYIHDDEFSVNKRHNKQPVNRNDSDSQLDNVMFDNEPVPPLSTVSSNLSLNSCCSNVSQNSKDSQDNNPPTLFHCSDGPEDVYSNGNVMPCNVYSSPQKDSNSSQGSRSPLPTSSSTLNSTNNRTSPVPISGRVRQRNESSSSGGSWQMISGTGSLRGSTTANATIPDSMDNSFSSIHSIPGHASQESSTTVVEEETYHLTKRQNRLERLRTVFYTVYNQEVGLKMKDNSDVTGIGQLLGNFAEKVGIISTQRPNL